MLCQTPSTNSLQTSEDMKVWLLTKLIVEVNFDEKKIEQIEARLDKMSDRQLRILIETYKERVEKRDQAEAARQNYMQQQISNQAKLDLMQAQSYRDHLAREFDQRIAQSKMESNLVRQNIQNNNQFGVNRFNRFRRW